MTHIYEEKTAAVRRYWFYTLLAVILLSLIIAGVSFFISQSIIAEVVAFFITALFSAIVIIFSGWKNVREGEVWLTQIYGKHARVCRPGGFVMIPFVEKGHAAVSLKVEKTAIFGGAEDVEFLDTSAGIEASFLWQLKDDAQSICTAVYNVGDVVAAMTAIVENTLRSEVADKPVDEVSKNKRDYGLNIVNDNDKLRVSEWGVELKGVILADIRLPENVVAERNKVLVAEKEAQVAETQIKKEEFLKRVAEVKAQADLVVKELKAKGEAAQVKALMESCHMTNAEALAYLTNKVKYGSGANIMIIEGNGNSGVEQGLALGAGLNAANNMNNNNNQSQTNS